MPTAEQVQEQSLFQRKMNFHMERTRKMYQDRRDGFSMDEVLRRSHESIVHFNHHFKAHDNMRRQFKVEDDTEFEIPEELSTEERLDLIEKRLDKIEGKSTSLVLSPTQSEIEFFSKGILCK